MHSAFTDLHQDGHLLQDYKCKKYISLNIVIILVYNIYKNISLMMSTSTGIQLMFAYASYLLLYQECMSHNCSRSRITVAVENRICSQFSSCSLTMS